MNKEILNTGVQSFIDKNINTDIMSVLLKKSIFQGVSPQELAQQIESKKKCQKKLPTWFETPGIYYPKKINIEQTSSEISAQYKSEIIAGKSVADLTGGFGIDSYYFSKKIASVFYCEIDADLHEIASHNFKILSAKNIQAFAKNGLDFLKGSDEKFDWIYIDPSRRNKTKGKVFQLSDCEPNIADNLAFIFRKSDTVLIKTAPLLDISMGISELSDVKEIHIVAINNDVKELLWVLEKGAVGKIRIRTINFTKSGQQHFDFLLNDEKHIVSQFSAPLKYLYEPNASILKSGAFKTIGKAYGLHKLQQHTHLYTSNALIDFSGRRFQIISVNSYNKKSLKNLNIKKANITTRNFPDSVATIRKKFNITEGGNSFLFFFKNLEDIHQVALCHKV